MNLLEIIILGIVERPSLARQAQYARITPPPTIHE